MEQYRLKCGESREFIRLVSRDDNDAHDQAY
jgi:hypothetical protein